MAGGNVPSTARLEFTKRLQELYEAAERPNLKEVAERSGVKDRKGKASNKPISAWMSPSGYHPGSWQTFRPVLKDLIRLVADSRAFTAKNAALGDEDQWKRWYRDAVSASRARSAPAGFDAACKTYIAQLRRRHAQLAVVASPHSPVRPGPLRLTDVFVAPAVRPETPTRDGGPGAPPAPQADASAPARWTLDDGRTRPALQVLAQEDAQRIVLLGNPGHGKSTLARYLALALAEALDSDHQVGADLAPLTGALPLLVELGAYANPQWRTGTLLDLVDRLHHAQGPGLPKDVLDAYLRSGGRAVLIFDGLDEVFDPRLREEVTGEIAGLAERYPNVRIVVTSRIVDYQHAVLEREGFRIHVLRDFDRARIDAFVTRWYRSAFPEQPAEAARLRERLLAAIDDTPSAAELAGNPLMLTMLALRGEHRDLPRDRRAVLEQTVSAFIAQWDPGRFARDKRVAEDAGRLRAGERMELLRRVAHRMQIGAGGMAGNLLTDAELTAELNDYLRDKLPPERSPALTRVMLEEFRVRNGIISHFGGAMYGFLHRALLEYLDAADIHHRITVERSLTEDALVHQEYGEHWNDPSRHESLVLTAGMVEPRVAGRIVAHLLAADPLWFVRLSGASSRDIPHHIVLAARCLGEVRDPGALPAQCSAVVSAVIALIEHVVAERVRPGSPVMRAVEETLPPVLARLGARCPAVHRLYCDWYLARGQFLSVMREGENFAWLEVPPAAQVGAALLGDHPEFYENLYSQAAFGSAPATKVEALRALIQERPQDPRLARLLCDFAEADPDGEMRERSVGLFALARRTDPSAACLLRGWLKDDDTYLRRGALGALVNGWRDEPGTYAAICRYAADDPHSEVRLTAVRCLASGWPGDPDAGAVVRERAGCDPDPHLRTSVFRILAEGWPDDPLSAALLEAIAADPADERWLRETALRTLDWLRAGPVRPASALAASPAPPEDPRITELGPLVVERRADVRTHLLLRERAEAHPDADVRVAAVRVLATEWRTDPRTLPWLCELAASQASESVRQAALWALGSLWPGDPEAGAVLRRIADGKGESRTREMAVLAVTAGWRDDADTRLLLRRLAVGLDATYVRATAIRMLGASLRDDPATEEVLRERAENDPDSYVRTTAVRALVLGFRTSRTRDLLRRLAVDAPDNFLRAEAIHLLAAGWREERATGELLRRIATDGTGATSRRAAVEALAGGWRHDPATEVLLRERAADNFDWALRQAAVQALADRWPHDPEMAALAEFLADDM
ncbi:HEAT repeat domain-containing protein [Streptomyces sp. NRRL F-2747]|uniref:HEAT repeat domain-containing protein n=1 Tax=Streptomyces sp. NRRL F-2747 TaxID=1463843 RepID=UPI00099D9C2D|nr:HEAT repeat domain-containing protein [Streptomyces sp. NRRL F-2747]